MVGDGIQRHDRKSSKSIEGLHVIHWPPLDTPRDTPGILVVLVHGALDRAESFSRVVRRLRDLHVIAYDRRGYGASRARDAGHERGIDLADLANDLETVVGAFPSRDAVVAVGHSLGGTVVLTAATRVHQPFHAVGAFEPPAPWLEGQVRPSTPGPVEISRRVEDFYRRTMGDGAWDRLSVRARGERLNAGAALVGDLDALERTAQFVPEELRVPAVLGCGGASRDPRYQVVTSSLADRIANTSIVEIPGAGHGAHLTHPDAYAAFVRTTVRCALVDHRSSERVSP
jgi:pimeloyl-ACP methyl ester carboxylesterase